MAVPTCTFLRFWRIGGEHNAQAREKVVNEVFSALPANKRWDAALAHSVYRNLALTEAEICVGLSPEEARFVSVRFGVM